MLTTLYVFLCFATHSHAGITINSNNATSALPSAISTLNTNAMSSSSRFVVENELAKISASCLSSRDYELLAGNFIKHGIVRTFSFSLLSISAMSIGLAELRRALNFAPPRPWKSYNDTKASEGELASVSNIEAYYDLIEPIPSLQSLDNPYYFEKNIATAIVYLDERLPLFRSIFRRRFEEMRQFDQGSIDRKSIDRMIDDLLTIHDKIEKAISKMRRNDYKCWD